MHRKLQLVSLADRGIIARLGVLINYLAQQGFSVTKSNWDIPAAVGSAAPAFTVRLARHQRLSILALEAHDVLQVLVILFCVPVEHFQVPTAKTARPVTPPCPDSAARQAHRFRLQHFAILASTARAAFLLLLNVYLAQLVL